MSETERIREYFRSTTWRASAGREYLVRERTALLRAAAAALGQAPGELSICDVGCGGGADLAAWRDFGVPEGQLAGTELVPERALLAQQRLPRADVREVDGVELPFAPESFDICTASLVISTIGSVDDRGHLLREMERVTRPGGIVAVYDFRVRKPWNRSVKAVSTHHISELLREPDAVEEAAPFLPILELALRLPRPLRVTVTRLLPQTHRLWIWRRPASDSVSA